MIKRLCSIFETLEHVSSLTQFGGERSFEFYVGKVIRPLASMPDRFAGDTNANDCLSG